MSIELVPITEFYKEIFVLWNKHFFNNALPVPIFIINPESKRENKTDFIKLQWIIDGTSKYEMRINPYFLSCSLYDNEIELTKKLLPKCRKCQLHMVLRPSKPLKRNIIRDKKQKFQCSLKNM